jgi:hypothetical protein
MDADSDPAYHCDADLDPAYHFDADVDSCGRDPDPQHCFTLCVFLFLRVMFCVLCK